MQSYPAVILPMPSSARAALQLYLKQENRRSLRELATECAKQGVTASLPTLKRWSVRFGWQRAVAEHDRAAAEESVARTIDYRAAILHDKLKLIDIAKSRYDWLIDPESPDVTPAQRERAEKITVSDFLRIIKMELDALNLLRTLEASRLREAPRRPPAQTNAYEMDSKVKANVEAYIRKKHGLPPTHRESRNENLSSEPG